MPTTKHALKQYLFRAFLFFLMGGLAIALLLAFLPMKSQTDKALLLILGSTASGGFYVIAKYIDKRINERTMQSPRGSKLFDTKTYGMLLIVSPFVFLLAMGKGLYRLIRKED